LSGPISVQELKAGETLHVDERSLDKNLLAKKVEDGLFVRVVYVISLPEAMRKPIFLPQDHLFVIMLLRDLHERRWHYGYKSLIHETRKRFWNTGLSRRARTHFKVCCMQKTAEKTLQLLGQIPKP